MISREDAIKGITATADEISKPKDHKIEAAEATRVEIDGRKQYFSLRKDWSRYIARWITGLIIFNALLSVGVGLEWLTFSNMEWRGGSGNLDSGDKWNFCLTSA